METQKILNLLNNTDNENSKFAAQKWCVIGSQSKGKYSNENQIKSFTSSLESNLCNYSDAYIFVTGNINVTGGDANRKVAFGKCAPFRKCGKLLLMMQNINIAMPMYNLVEYSDNYSDPSGSLLQFKKD